MGKNQQGCQFPRARLGMVAVAALAGLLSTPASRVEAAKDNPEAAVRHVAEPSWKAGLPDLSAETRTWEGVDLAAERGGGITQLWAENFDSGMGSLSPWTFIGGFGLWHTRLGTDCATGGPFSNVAAFSRTGACDFSTGSGVQGGMLTPIIDATAFDTLFLQFLHFHDGEDIGDVCGPFSGFPFIDRMEIYACDSTGFPLLELGEFFGDQPWALRGLDASVMAGQTFRLAFFFTSGDELCNLERGTWLDNIELLGQATVVDPCDEETTDPIILNCPSDFTTTCNGDGGFYFNYYPDVLEDCSYNYELSWTNPIPYGVNPLSVTVTDQAGNVATCEFTVTVVPDPKDPYRRYSIGQHDGWVREPDMVNMIEGPVNTKASTFDVGDGSDNWGRRGVLSFDTSGVPANATITAAYLRLTRSTAAGNTTPLGRLILDMGPNGASPVRGGGGAYIGPNALLEPMDYLLEAALNLDVAPSFPVPAANNYTSFAYVDSAFYDAIDRTGLTQFRVRFENESDDDNQNDFISFHSGDSTSSVVRPELVIEYYVEDCQPCGPVNACDAPVAATFWSTPAEDGGLMESHFTSEVGGTANSGATSSPVGDSASRQQHMVLLNFDTSSIPSDALITSAELRVFRVSATGGWSAFGPIWVGMRNPCSMPWWYGASGLLAASDFEAINSISPVGTLTVPSTNTYTSTFLSPAGLAAINRGGVTQMKLFYPTADDGDAISDQVQLATGNYGATSPGRPRLVVTYEPCGGNL